MYCKYTYNDASATAILANLVNLLTDQVTSMSTITDCIVANSSITNTWSPSGWVVHDQVSASVVVLKAPIYDIPTKFKYLYLDVLTAGFINTKVYETWDAVAHTGTYPTNSAVIVFYVIPIVLNAQGTIYFSSSPRHAVFYTLLGTTINGPYGVTERTRVGAWDTTANAFCNTFQLNSTSFAGSTTSGYAPYIVNVAAAGAAKISAAAATCFLATQYNTCLVNGIYVGTAGLYTSLDANLNQVYGLRDLGVVYPVAYNNEGGDITSLTNIYVAPYNLGNHEDTYTVGANSFVQLGINSSRLTFMVG